MAEKSTIARPYAKALFEFACERHKLAEYSQVLEVAATVVTDERVRKLLSNPLLTPGDLSALILDIATAALNGQGVDDHARNFIVLLAANRRLGLLPEIADVFARLRAELENRLDVTVTSATPLDETLRQRYTNALKQRLKRDIRLHETVDPALLGGAILRANDLVIDGSLRGRLERLGAAVAA